MDEIYFEHADLLKRLWKADYLYLARDYDGKLKAYEFKPVKFEIHWVAGGGWDEKVGTDNFPEVKWSDEEPTMISELLASYENGGENGE